jgi:tetratricopeptide (TPR) repeat protein
VAENKLAALPLTFDSAAGIINTSVLIKDASRVLERLRNRRRKRMALDPVTMTLLGIPLSWLTSYGYDKLKQLSERIKSIPSQDLFFKSFNKSLDKHKNDYKEGVKKFKASLKGHEDEFIEILNAHMKDFSSFVTAINDGSFQRSVAADLVARFDVEENFKDVMEIIVRQCLEDYRKTFYDTMTEKEGIVLILELLGIIMKPAEQKEEEPKKEAEKPGKQIKILSIMASPQDELSINYEREQDTMLKAFKSFDREEVFLDMPDPVKSTLMEIHERLQDSSHDILHITAHGSINEEGEGILALEDHRGQLVNVTGSELAKKLHHKPRIVILSACHSARKEPQLMPVAKTLRKAGIEVVIGMKKKISHDAAIDFNIAFFQSLYQQETVQEAFNRGKDAITIGEENRKKENPSWDITGEQEIPELLADKKGKKLTKEEFSDHRIEAPGRPESHMFGGAKYLERGFIGRRQILREIYRAIEKQTGAIVLKGPGGIGKSTLTTRVTANLSRQNYGFIVIRDNTTVEQILEAISKAATAKDVKDAEAILEQNWDSLQKLSWFMENFFSHHKTVLIFDNFEVNQDEKSGDFLEAEEKQRLKKFLWQFREWLTHNDSVLLFSTRYKLPGFDSPEVQRDIREFTETEFRKMLWNSKALKRLDGKSSKDLMQEVGGNPRALELLDKIAYKEYERKDFSWEQLKDLMPELQVRIIHRESADDDFTPLFLDRLIGYLTVTQRLVLDIFSVFRKPVPMEVLAAHKATMVRKDRDRLVDLSLLEWLKEKKEDLFYVHRLTAQYLLEQMGGKLKKKYHYSAARYFDGIRTEEGEVYLEDLIEARWHYLRASRWTRAAELTFDLEDYLRLHGAPQWAMELLLELELKKLKKIHKGMAHNRIGILHHQFGEYDEALSRYQKALEIFRELDDQKGLAVNLHLIGYISQDKGNYGDALQKYQESLKIHEQIGDLNGIAENLHHIGMILQDKGNYKDALQKYQESLEIKRKTGDTQGISIALHQIGMIYQDKGNHEDALQKYQESLEIKRKIGDTRGIASNLHQIGIIHQEKGNYEDALQMYQESLEIKQQIGDTRGIASALHEIGNLHYLKGNYEDALQMYQECRKILEELGAQKEIATVLYQIGMMHHKKGNYEDALQKFQEALKISEKIGDISGMAFSMGQMGQLHVQFKQYETALEYFIQAFLIFVKLESPHVNGLRNDIYRVREKLPAETFEEILKKFDLKPELFDQMEAQDQQKKFTEFISSITRAALSAGEASSKEKEELIAQLNQIIEQLPDDEPEAEGLKSYLQLLLACVNGEDLREYLDKIPGELREMFDSVKSEGDAEDGG